MGREVRRVPANWQHPENDRDYQPMHDRDYESAITEWIESHQLWLQGKHPSQLEYPAETAELKYFAQWDGNAPDIEYYRPKWKNEERTHYQMYETCSEGTPISPVMADPKELAQWLADNNASFFGNNTTSAEHWLAIITGEDHGLPVFVMRANS